MKSWIVSALLLINLNASYAYAEAPATRTLCVYDPSGAHGDAFRVAQDYRDAAMAWGVAFTLKPYTDERTAAEDFKAQQCHAVLLTGTRARPFNPFSSTIEAVGSLPTYAQLGTVIKHLAAPNARQLLQSGPYETLALFPAGAVYLFVRDGGLHALGDLAGRRIATMDYDPAARRLVHEVGASMVTADVGTFAPMFNNGAVDACYAPAVAYAPLELSKGLGKQGGIVRYPWGSSRSRSLAAPKICPQALRTPRAPMPPRSSRGCWTWYRAPKKPSPKIAGSRCPRRRAAATTIYLHRYA